MPTILFSWVMLSIEILPGEQPAILDRDLFGAVQAKLNEQRNNHTVARSEIESLLIGRIYDDRGNRMTPSHVRKGGSSIDITCPHPSCMGGLGVPDPLAGCLRPRSRLSSRPPFASISRISQQVMTETSSATTSSGSRSKRTSWRLSSRQRRHPATRATRCTMIDLF